MKQVLSINQIGRDPGQRSLTLAEFASLPWPSDEQFEAFVEHVCDVHSWYKHLPLREGGEFYFYLANDAGGGYSAESPRLHHSWQTTEDYRRRFGFMDYSGPFGRDAGAKLSLPPEIIEATRIVLFPFVCKCYNATEACLSRVPEAYIEGILSGGSKSITDDDVLSWYHSQRKKEANWQLLSNEESDQAIKIDDNDTDLELLPKAVADFVRSEREALSIYRELQEKEEGKVRRSLSRLRVLHQRLSNGGAAAS